VLLDRDGLAMRALSQVLFGASGTNVATASKQWSVKNENQGGQS